MFRLNIELMISICNLLLENSFLDFSNFFQVLCFRCSRAETLEVLHGLDWSWMHEADNSWVPLVVTRFTAFLDKCIQIRVSDAFCYVACKNLFVGINPMYHLNVLRELSTTHHLSFLSYHIFMPVYDIESVQFCARSIACQVSSSGHFKEFLLKNCRILNVRNDYSRVGWVRDPSLPPPLPLCALLRSDSDGHFNPYRWPALYKDILSTECSLCSLQILLLIIFR